MATPNPCQTNIMAFKRECGRSLLVSEYFCDVGRALLQAWHLLCLCGRRPSSPLARAVPCALASNLFLADIFVPHIGVFANKKLHHGDALPRIQIDDVHAQGAEPIEATREGSAFPLPPRYECRIGVPTRCNTSRALVW